MKNNLLDMNLQYFAEPDTDPEPQGGEGDEPTVKVAEMKRRLEKEQEKYQAELDAIKSSQEEKIKQAIEQAQKEAKMNADELAEYKKTQADKNYQEELDKSNRVIEEYKLKEKRREIRDESINKLNELGLTVNDDTLKIVNNADSFDGMAELADALSTVIKADKNDRATSTAPNASGGNNSKQNQSAYDILDGAKKTPL